MAAGAEERCDRKAEEKNAGKCGILLGSWGPFPKLINVVEHT